MITIIVSLRKHIEKLPTNILAKKAANVIIRNNSRITSSNKSLNLTLTSFIKFSPNDEYPLNKKVYSRKLSFSFKFILCRNTTVIIKIMLNTIATEIIK